MKIWLSKNSEVSVREQLIAQITLGITSGDLSVGDKLPSTQEVARRFQIHANTVSNAYQKLAEAGWIEFRRGSGFYVCEVLEENSTKEFALDALINDFVRQARSKGFSGSEIQKHLEKWFSNQPEQIVLIESDADFREILIEEIRQATGFKTCGISFADFQREGGNFNAVFAAMSDEEAGIRSALPAGKTCVYLKSRSVPAALDGEARPDKGDLIAIVSGWERFLFWAKTILIAANVESDSLVIRSTKTENWQNGLKNASMIICDSLTAKKISQKERARIFYLISDDSLNELRNFTKP